MSTAPDIRLATAADLPAVAAIYDHEVLHGTATFDTVPRSGEQWRDWLAGHDPDRHPVLVAADPEQGVLGWASLTAWSPRGAYSATVEASVFVPPAQQGRGIGTRLTAALVEAAARCGHRVILGRIEASNGTSLRLFERAGFRTVGTLHAVGCKFGRELDVVMVEKLIPQAE